MDVRIFALHKENIPLPIRVSNQQGLAQKSIKVRVLFTIRIVYSVTVFSSQHIQRTEVNETVRQLMADVKFTDDKICHLTPSPDVTP